MGFNIAGLVINTNFDRDIHKLEHALNWGIEIIEEVNFEQASSNWTPEGEFRLHFTDKATMIFFPHEWVVHKYHASSHDTLNYAYSATAMAFNLDYFKDGRLTRSIVENDELPPFKEGEPLAIERENMRADELIFDLFDVLLQEPFGNLDLDAKSFRCKLVPFSKKQTSKPEIDLSHHDDLYINNVLKNEKNYPKEVVEAAKYIYEQRDLGSLKKQRLIKQLPRIKRIVMEDIAKGKAPEKVINYMLKEGLTENQAREIAKDAVARVKKTEPEGSKSKGQFVFIILMIIFAIRMILRLTN